MTGARDARCPLCSGQELREVSEYRYSSDHHAVLGCREILFCDECRLGFAHPMPDAETLTYFYGSVYRHGPLNPYRVDRPDKVTANPWADSQLDFLLNALDISAITSVVDVGSGYGFLLRGLRSRFPHLQLYALDEDTSTAQYLEQYGITVNPHRVVADLALSSHSLEHFTNPRAFRDIVTQAGARWLLLEIPNCDNFSPQFVPRAYDSPHLLFFSKDSTLAMARRFGWVPVRVDTVGWSLHEELIALQREKEFMRSVEKLTRSQEILCRLQRRLKMVVKALVPGGVLSYYRRTPREAQASLESQWYRYGGARWSIRCLFAIREGDG